MSRSSPPSLDVLRASPVRGQLEPYDPRTPKGCRYIQTTDTPDELKVLLPPGTASMYEQLLKLENYELSKKPSVSWGRIMEIRHLKDRMIRKCQKLAKTAAPMPKKSSRGDAFVFQTFVTPLDFRVKEMEKWFREQQKRATSLPRRTISYGPHELSITGPLSRQLPSSSSSKQPMQRSIANPEGSMKQRQALLNKPLPTIQQPQRLVQSERRPSLPSGALPVPPNLNDVMSPPPLPVLLLSQREAYGLDTEEQPNIASLSIGPDQPPGAGPSDPPAEATPRPTLSRRPSCIKRNSMGDMKNVSWADNHHDLDNQFSKYATAAREAQASGKWEEVRVLYLEQIAGLENLQQQVQEGLEHLRSETDHLQRIDETVRKQREALDTTFHAFEQKHTLLKEKVQEALTEANDALNRHGVPRELQPIHESES